MSTKGIVDYHISNHAKQRFAERIMGRDNTYDVNKFILEHEAKIQTDICKMVEYGDLIFTGKQSQKDGKGKVVDVYLNDCWVVLVDNKSMNVITLFKVDLGVDDDFNRQYIEKMMEKLNRNKEELDGVQAQILEENEEYRGFIEEAETQIKEYRAMIKHMEELCSGYKTIIDNNCVKVSQATKAVTETINTLIGKKEF